MRLIKNYIYNVGYQIFVLILPLITVPYVSRVLGSEGVGINAFTNSIISYFILFGSIGINLYGNRTIAYVRNDREKTSQTFWEIAFLRMITITMSYVAFLIFLVIVNNYKVYYFYQSFLIIAAGLDISWFFMGIEDFKRTVTRNTIVKIVSLIAIFTFVKTSSDVGIYILILSLSILFGNLTLWPYMKKLVNKPDFSKLNLKKHIRPSLALFVPQVATQVYLVLNKTMLGFYSGVVASGYYENTDKIVKIVLAIVTATGTVMLPRVANIFANGDKDGVKKYLYKSFDFVSAICYPMTLGLAAIAPKFTIWFLSDEFAITAKLLPVLSLVILLIGWSNVLGTQYLLPTNQNRYFTTSVVVGAVANLGLNFFLIPWYDVYGAVWATVISEFLVTAVQIYYVRTNLNIQILFKGNWKYLIGSLIMFGIVRFMNVSMDATLIGFLIQVIAGIIIYALIIFFTKAPIITQLKNLLVLRNK
ncbi:flippase [Floricoccus penangensis]|uniref:flippase n=1 Tax=Floricoccus penangensis TaxID=1859475 RepID=UPI00203FF174|nr:flippase [Floricoccus penangensis]URZ87630.1 flippase [Floricoccus penangensis]